MSISSRVLRQLVRESGEDVQDVVISIPAYFSDNQRHATIKAAELTGLTVVSLISEPTAATIYASKSREALSPVYDPGGGAFDVSVVDSRFDDYNVQAIGGCTLGDDNSGANIRRWVIKQGNIRIHHLSSEDLIRLKWDCSKLKIRLQKSRRDEVSDLILHGARQVVFTTEIYSEIAGLTFSEIIIKARKVLGEAASIGEECDLIMVGGLTRCPLLREWIAKKTGQKPIEMFHDPDKIATQGATLYAQVLSDGTTRIQVGDMTKALSIEMADGFTCVLIPCNSKIPVQETTVVHNSVASNKLQLNLYQGDNLLASQNEFIGRFTYSYDGVILTGEDEVIMEITVEVGGVICFSCKGLLKAPAGIVLDRTKASI